MIKRSLLVLPWASLAFVAAVTLCPLAQRPHLFDARVEHFSTYAVIGLLFCLVYPRQTFLICLVVLGAAILLEGMQLLTPDRHGRVADLEFKCAGGIAGIVAGKIVGRFAVLRL